MKVVSLCTVDRAVTTLCKMILKPVGKIMIAL